MEYCLSLPRLYCQVNLIRPPLPSEESTGIPSSKPAQSHTIRLSPWWAGAKQRCSILPLLTLPDNDRSLIFECCVCLVCYHPSKSCLSLKFGFYSFRLHSQPRNSGRVRSFDLLFVSNIAPQIHRLTLISLEPFSQIWS